MTREPVANQMYLRRVGLGMELQEEFRFLAESRTVINQLQAWSDERADTGGATPEERKVLAEIRLKLRELKEILSEMRRQ